MVAPDAGVERRALRISLVTAAALGIAGVLWGLATGSQLILLDGAYAFIGVAVSWLLLAVSRVVGRGPNHVYPYGREALTPLVVGVQGFVLLGTVAFADEHTMRLDLERRLDALPFDVWLNFELFPADAGGA